MFYINLIGVKVLRIFLMVDIIAKKVYKVLKYFVYFTYISD